MEATFYLRMLMNLLKNEGKQYRAKSACWLIQKIWLLSMTNVGAFETAFGAGELGLDCEAEEVFTAFGAQEMGHAYFETARLRQVDLSPLRACKKLDTLSLSRNMIRTIDLTPLGRCHSLKNLYVDGNSLRKVDLSLLRRCTYVRCLDFRDNRLKTLDLSPLSNCHALAFLSLYNNRFERLDLTPLLSCPALRFLDVDSNVTCYIDRNAIRANEEKGKPIPRALAKINSSFKKGAVEPGP